MATIKKKAYGAKREPEQEIVTLANKVSDLVRAKSRVFTIALSLAAVFLVLVSGYTLVKSMNERKAAPLLETAYKEYKAAAPDLAKALELFRAVQKKYPSTPSGAIASLYAANCLMDSGRNEEALKEYQAMTGKYSGDTFLLGLVYNRMGYLYTSLGRREDAVKAFELSDSLAGPNVATIELARLYEAAGNTAASHNKYKTIADKLAGSAWAREASGKIQQIQPAPGAVSEQKK